LEKNAKLPSDVTLSGIVTLVKALLSSNALFPIVVIGYPPAVESIVTAPLQPLPLVTVASKPLSV